MNHTTPERLLIMDACVLIDYMKGELELFKLISSHIGPIFVATPIIEEVDFINNLDELEELGLIPLEPELEDVFQANELGGQTSFQDNICYLTAIRQGMTCVTNDKNLRKRCVESEVPIIWGMELILKLVEANGITCEEALIIAEEIHKANPHHIGKKVLKSFKLKLEACV